MIRDRDVLVDILVGDAPYIQREPGSSLPRHTRYAYGSEIEIPWPTVDVPAMRPFPGDTRRLEVEKRTYTPSVQRNPLPQLSIIDELRPKYRIDRMSHEHDYVRRKIVEDARSKWYEGRGINTPAMELQQKVRERSVLRAQERQDALKAGVMTAEALSEPELEVDPLLEDLESGTAVEDQDRLGYDDDLEKEIVIHDAPKEPRSKIRKMRS